MNRIEILKPYSEKLGVTIDGIIGKCRNRFLADVRKVICYDLREKKLKLKDIAFILRKDHTTVVYNIQAYKDNYEYNLPFRGLADKIKTHNGKHGTLEF